MNNDRCASLGECATPVESSVTDPTKSPFARELYDDAYTALMGQTSGRAQLLDDLQARRQDGTLDRTLRELNAFGDVTVKNDDGQTVISLRNRPSGSLRVDLNDFSIDGVSGDDIRKASGAESREFINAQIDDPRFKVWPGMTPEQSNKVKAVFDTLLDGDRTGFEAAAVDMLNDPYSRGYFRMALKQLDPASAGGLALRLDADRKPILRVASGNKQAPYLTISGDGFTSPADDAAFAGAQASERHWATGEIEDLTSFFHNRGLLNYRREIKPAELSELLYDYREHKY